MFHLPCYTDVLCKCLGGDWSNFIKTYFYTGCLVFYVQAIKFLSLFVSRIYYLDLQIVKHRIVRLSAATIVVYVSVFVTVCRGEAKSSFLRSDPKMKNYLNSKNYLTRRGGFIRLKILVFKCEEWGYGV